MMHTIHDRRPAILLVVLLVALFALMAGQVRGGPLSKVEGMLLYATSPLLRGVHVVTEGVREIWSRAAGGESPSRIRELEKTVTTLEVESQRYQDQLRENERLRGLLDLKQSLPISTLAATVLSNSFRGASRTCLIDRGDLSGLKPDMPVVNPQGVVGRIWAVGRGISKVQLLTDSSAGASVLVQRTRVQGVLVGRGDQILELRYVSSTDDVQSGDLLLTSGMDQIYPRGLPVGVVAEVLPGGGLQRTVTVVPRVDFDRLEEVLVLLRSDLPLERGEPKP
jgi:rod shape-determining protein MreC